MYRVETHFHTAESSPCGAVPAAQGVEIYRRNGYHGIIVSDHFGEAVCGSSQGQHWNDVVARFLRGYRAAKVQGDNTGMDVFLGMELRFPHDENDFLLFGITEEFLFAYPWFYEGELTNFYPIARANQILIVQAHPFRIGCTPADPCLLDGVEIRNGNPRFDSRNDHAEAWSCQHGLFATSGTDFHELGDDAATYGIGLTDRPSTLLEIIGMLSKKKHFLL